MRERPSRNVGVAITNTFLLWRHRLHTYLHRGIFEDVAAVRNTLLLWHHRLHGYLHRGIFEDVALCRRAINSAKRNPIACPSLSSASRKTVVAFSGCVAVCLAAANRPFLALIRFGEVRPCPFGRIDPHSHKMRMRRCPELRLTSALKITIDDDRFTLRGRAA